MTASTNLVEVAPRRGGFDAALSGSAETMELDDGRRISLPVQSWRGDAPTRDVAARAPGSADATTADSWMLERCAGPTIDLGCGPGRMVAGLLSRGVPALGVDSSLRAVLLCTERGVPAVRRDVFARLPGEPRWRHVLLADGNIGIGGDPIALLRRTRALLVAGGSVLVEAMPDQHGLWCGTARLRDHAEVPGPWFPWATIGVAALSALARRTGLRVVDVLDRQERSVVQLARGLG